MLSVLRRASNPRTPDATPKNLVRHIRVERRASGPPCPVALPCVPARLPARPSALPRERS